MFYRILVLLSLFCSSFATGARAAENWSPLDVDVWNPPFNTERKTERQRYTALNLVSRIWTVCVSIPHLKDAYWLAVNYGLIMEARRFEIRMSVTEAGGYDKLDRQRQQIDECMAASADALIVGAISADGLNDLVEKYTARGKPVIDLINGISSPKITARAAVDFFDMGRLAGEYLKNLVQASAGPVKIAWFPGPEGAGWSKAGDQGIRAALKGSTVDIARTAWGDTGLAAQAKLISDALDSHPDVAFIVGTSVSAEAAIQELRRRKKDSVVKVISYYYSPAVHRGILRGAIAASPSDVPALQARLAVDLAMRALEKQPFPKHVAAPIQLLDKTTIPKTDLSASLAPDWYKPILTVNIK